MHALFGRGLKDYGKALGGQEAVARLLQVSTRTIRNWKRDKYLPKRRLQHYYLCLLDAEVERRLRAKPALEPVIAINHTDETLEPEPEDAGMGEELEFGI